MGLNTTITWGRFVWHAEKERQNLSRHGISFKLAVSAFLDPCRVIVRDAKHSDAEDRWFCIGKVGYRVITVRFTYRDRRTRIIGAGCWRKERKFYEKIKTNRS